MSRIRACVLGSLGVLVVFAASAVAASTAVAVEKFELLLEPCREGKIVAFCWTEKEGEELLELSGNEEFSLEKDEGTMFLRAAFGETIVEIQCKKMTNNNTGKIVQPKPLEIDYEIKNLFITFEECAITSAIKTKCIVPATLKTKELKANPETDEAVRKLTEKEIRVIPEANEESPLMEVEIENNGGETCPAAIRGISEITGSQNCEWQEILTDLLEHLFHCEVTGSLLKFDKFVAEFTVLAEVKLLNLEDYWDIEEEA
jgi:hypothetical protein